MKFEKSLESVPVEMTADPLWRMEVYRLAIFAGELGWHGAKRLSHDKRTVGLSDQLYRAVGSIGSNISEGCSPN